MDAELDMDKLCLMPRAMMFQLDEKRGYKHDLSLLHRFRKTLAWLFSHTQHLEGYPAANR